MITVPRLTPCANFHAMIYHVKVNFEDKKKSVLPNEKFRFLALASNKLMLRHLIICFSLHYLSSGRLRKVKNIRENFKLVAVVEAVAYKRIIVRHE